MFCYNIPAIFLQYYDINEQTSDSSQSKSQLPICVIANFDSKIGVHMSCNCFGGKMVRHMHSSHMTSLADFNNSIIMHTSILSINFKSFCKQERMM